MQQNLCVSAPGQRAPAPPSRRPDAQGYRDARPGDAAARASAAADELTDDLVLGGPGALNVMMRPTAAGIDALLLRTDPMQRPWGVTLGPPASERFWLARPQDVGAVPTHVVHAQAVLGFGFELAPGLSLPLVGLLVWLLPASVVGTAPKAVLAVLSFLALSLSPRGGLSHHHLVACERPLSAEALASVAARRASFVQRALAWLNLDGLRALPAPFAAQPADTLPEVGETRRAEQAGSRAWGMGMLCGPVWVGSLRHSVLHHDSHARCLEVARPDADTVRVQLSEVQAQPWRASFFTGLLWGSEHSGQGRQVVRVGVCERSPEGARAEQLVHAAAEVLEGTQEFANGVVDAAVLQIEQVRSHGAGWRWPFWLPRYKSFGVGQVRQRFVVTRRGANAAGGRVALGVLGMDETLHGGRVQWQTRLSWHAPADATDPEQASAWAIDVDVYLPWSSPKRREALVELLGLSQLCAKDGTPAPQDGWRRDLQLHLHAHASTQQLQRELANAAPPHPFAWFDESVARLGALGALLRRTLGESQLRSTSDDEAMLDALAEHGPGLFGALHTPPSEGDSVLVPRLRVHYGQTHTLLQDAGWHLARLGAGDAPSRAWKRRALKLADALRDEALTLLRDPLVRAMVPRERARHNDALVQLHRRLLRRAQPIASETTPLLPQHVG